MAAEGNPLRREGHGKPQLQRGRGAMAAEGRMPQLCSHSHRFRFNEAAARWPRKEETPGTATEAIIKLQRGRGAMAAEGLEEFDGVGLPQQASTRPRRDGRGRLIFLSSNRNIIVASTRPRRDGRGRFQKAITFCKSTT